MSKLRADITYSHRLHNSPISVEYTTTLDVNNTNETNQNPGNLNDSENNKDNDDPVINLEADSEQLEESSDNENTESQLENDFGEYLQGWANMLREEENADILDEEENTEFNNEKSNIPLDDITHPANDDNAKWKLLTLFNYNTNINLPF